MKICLIFYRGWKAKICSQVSELLLEIVLRGTLCLLIFLGSPYTIIEMLRTQLLILLLSFKKLNVLFCG